MSFEEFMDLMKQMIDELKAMSASLGLANTGDEYKVISELFTYKFLNDKLLYEFSHREDKEETFEEFVAFAGIEIPRMEEEHLIDSLYHKQNEPNFNDIFDKAFIEVNELNKGIYTIETVSGQNKPLFEPLSEYIRDDSKELDLARRAINILAEYKFEDIYEGGFDYFSTIFEYLIKDYNKDSGKYAEYFTPLFAGNIMADILYDDTPVSNVEIYDPAAGSGTLLLSLANKIGTRNATIYSQDISQKSTQFLRINLILNDLVHSLNNVIEGDTLTRPSHIDESNPNEVKKFDFIVSNPPFKMDFSSSIKVLENDKYNRFFSGLPNVPKKDKNSMAIYEVFLQHIISSLKNNGKAAVVVPSNFITAADKIPKNIRKHIIDNNWLRGVIHMPSNIFATTGTSVSILFIDKTKENNKILLMDASNLGTKTNLESGQRTLLSVEERNKIVQMFKESKEEPEFSTLVKVKEVQKNDYIVQAGHYYELKEIELDYDIDERILELKDEILESFSDSDKYKQMIRQLLSEEVSE
ncbi:class I SAM-dependent DNA methyltransferase [Streptococcus uberis]|uniref:HsdM family class I SAM-dependent methyltransferase n=1 Tax=Streptococcus uberis TaxID=1349 RepID=UPI0018A7BC8C|nr:N-6 DNA methylase [Streptococcus uberis]